MTTNTERAVVPKQENSATRDIVTIEQHQDRVNRELAELESRRNRDDPSQFITLHIITSDCSEGWTLYSDHTYIYHNINTRDKIYYISM